MNNKFAWELEIWASSVTVVSKTSGQCILCESSYIWLTFDGDDCIAVHQTECLHVGDNFPGPLYTLEGPDSSFAESIMCSLSWRQFTGIRRTTHVGFWSQSTCNFYYYISALLYGFKSIQSFNGYVRFRSHFLSNLVRMVVPKCICPIATLFRACTGRRNGRVLVPRLLQW